MKKLFSLLILIIAFCSCSEEIKRNNVSVFQGMKNNETWIGADAKATVTGTSLSIQAVSLTETVILEVPVPDTTINPAEPSTHVIYVLGDNSSRNASYILSNGGGFYDYVTGTEGDGEIVITQYDGATVSGTFRFNAINIEGDAPEPTVNFQKGVVYKVNIVQ